MKESIRYSLVQWVRYKHLFSTTVFLNEEWYLIILTLENIYGFIFLTFHLKVIQEYVPYKFDHNLVMTTCGLWSQDYDLTPDNHYQEYKVRIFPDVKSSSNRVSNSWVACKETAVQKHTQYLAQNRSVIQMRPFVELENNCLQQKTTTQCLIATLTFENRLLNRYYI